jgi:hypothetical protein
METYTSNTSETANGSGNDSRPPRPSVIIEFIEGDLSKPVVYPNAGSFEADEAIRAEILRRWAGAYHNA